MEYVGYIQKSRRVEISAQNEGTDNKKIIIGNVDTDETASAIKASLSETDYTVRFIDGVLYIIGGSDDATAKAWAYFKLKFMQKDMSSLCIEEGFVYNSNTGAKSALTINGNDIEKYTIVHYNGHFAQKRANDIKTAIYNKTGIELTVVDDSAEESDYEILVGKTNRAESKAIRATYDRPNIYYDVAVSNNKLVVMAEGYTTLEMVSVDLEEYLNSTSETDINGSIITNNVKHYIDVDILDKTDDADLRVMIWNMAGPDVRNKFDFLEKQTDVILMYLPDVLGTNELYNGGGDYYAPTCKYVFNDILEYYFLVESPVDDTYGRPHPMYGDNPQNILYRKSSGLSVFDSGYQLLPPGDNFHGTNWAILEAVDGNKFIYSISHYTNSHENTLCPSQHVKLLNEVKAKHKNVSKLPAIISGDLYMLYGNIGYNVIPEAGYKDAQREALVNANNDITHGTNHRLEYNNTGVASIDLMFYNTGLEALKFKVIASQLALYASDHCPVITDFKF